MLLDQLQKWKNQRIIIGFIPPNNLKIKVPQNLLTQELQQKVLSLKPEIIEWYKQQEMLQEEFEERAAIIEFDGKLSRAEAEEKALKYVFQSRDND